MIKINTESGLRLLSPEEISAKVLEQLKDNAEKVTGRPVVKCVVTVPAQFNDS